ncbi:hypothetical protein JR316_0002935 [Psilocybe cubensis]|uniref:CENP-V/GFA domain-containing protein n=2 Tax=Psilocybe cubensis TaxID=181762 RepID=A0A8H7XZH6_PSICU|nr:hypothetical protein JR316_0002935 [Psilocybe cubensis]KAH9483467.1 hypothetical protein JR316_0002935 [Psilocybe cubensis]
MALTYVNASCHCGLNAFRVAFKTESLPITDDFCHCTTCRHVSGQLAIHQTSIFGPPLAREPSRRQSRSQSASRSVSRQRSDEGLPQLNGSANGNGNTTPALLSPPTIEITSAPDVPYDLSDLTKYETYSPNVTLYFCSSCSALLFWVPHRPFEKEEHWTVSVGALERTEGIINLGYHIWVGDTVDGGLAHHLRTVDGKQLTLFKEGPGSEKLPTGWTASEQPEQPGSEDDDVLHAHCHCGTIKFDITRPTEASTLPSAPYPDLLYSHSTSHLSKISNPQDEKWWLRPVDTPTPTKYLAGHCMCNTCRLTSGFEIQSWAFIPLANIVSPDTCIPLSLAEEDRRPVGLKQYIASTGKYRESCGKCGATVFSWQIDTPDLVSVSVGLLDDKNGARAEDWLDWHTKRVSFKEKAVSQSIAKGLEDSMTTI